MSELSDGSNAVITAGPRGTAAITAPVYAPPDATVGADDKYKYKYLIAIAVTLASVLELIDTSIVNVAIPHMMGNLGATLDEISWVSTGYIIANVIVIPMSGWLSAYFGRKKYLATSIMLFVTASFFCGAATSLGGLVFWRVIQGLGGGALLSTSQATLFEAFPPEEIGIGQAMFGIGVMVGPTIGPTLGGYIVDNYNWPWIFYINVPLGILAAIMVITYVHDAAHQERARTIDFLGFILLAVGVGSLQFMLEKGDRYDWFDSRLVTGLAVASVVSFVALVWRELTIDEPIINFRVLKSRQLAAGVSFAAALGLALFGSIFVLPIFLQALHGLSANQTGLVILPGAIASAVTMAFVGKNANRLDARATVTVGAVLFFIAMWMLARMTLVSGPAETFWPLIMRGVGMGLIFVPLTSATMAELKVSELAQGTGMFNLTRQLGGSLGIAIMATLLTRFTVEKKALLTEHVTTMDPTSLGRLYQVTQGLISRGVNPIIARTEALAVIDRQIQAQASVLAFSRIYLISGAILVGALPLMLLFKTGKGRGSGGMAH
ncbi:MAG TPA: DHA2 family efflux MFS transporter permease subunit [Gemmatimonadaceae bacterium]|nr:DHA2 family efflux MFS transporter permease subunit [Gemmatimonadaceae bacterium]